jgi:acyl-CoA thioester hydrolase
MEPHTTRIRVRYAETDQMGIVHHSNYYVWMEVARVELCESLGFRYRDMERNYGVGLAVVESKCRYAGSARFDDEVMIETRISDASARMVRFSYDMSVAGRPIAAGETRHVFVSKAMKPTRVPPQYRVFFGLPAI